MEFFQLTYQSKAVSSLDENDLNAILESATKNNAIHNITGCLVYYKGNFVQILEGTRDEVYIIYNKIIEDNRHASIDLLWECEAEQRFFKDWNMGFYRPSSEDETLFKTNYQLLSSLSERSNAILLSFWSAVDRALDF